ncbi:MAG: hypothetical protein ACRCZZ_08870 [Phocaeicola sp.]
MGLDMYLFKAKLSPSQQKVIDKNGVNSMEASKIYRAVTWDSHLDEVVYWRKASAIHDWFVSNIQNGVDECYEYAVSIDELYHLKSVCEQALETRDMKHLPSRPSTFVSYQRYWDSIESTTEVLQDILSDKIDDDEVYIYSSSW